MAVLQDININVFAQPSEKRLRSFLVLSQNENGRTINFRILGSPLPSSCTATLSGTKPDGNVYSTSGIVAGNFVIVQEDIQMTAVAGVWDAKLDIVNGSHNIMTAIIRITVEGDVVAPGSVPSNSQLDGYIAQAKFYAEESRVEAYGSPLTAATKSAMIDKNRVYVYTGSELNMTAGNWYYWNGTAWVSGGVYNSAAVDTDTTLTLPDKAADAKAVGDALADVKEDLSDITVTGFNKFNKSKAIQGKYIAKDTGAETANSAFYHSDFIPVEASTDYTIGVGVGSPNNFLTVAFYNSSKEFISGSFNGSVNAYTVTTPNNCAYIIVNGTLTRLDQQYVEPRTSGTVSNHPSYGVVVNGRNEAGVYLISASEIFYDTSTNTLKSTDSIYLCLPDETINYGPTIYLGSTTGAYLLWDSKAGTLKSAVSYSVSDKDKYLVALLSKTREVDTKKQFCTIDSAFPIFTVDLIANTLTVKVEAQPCYLIYNGVYFSIAKNFTQTLTLTNHCLVYYDPVSGSFGVATSFDFYNFTKGITVLVRYYRNVYCRVGFETPVYNDTFKNIVCYGDSLTWYDGNNFTWGPHQGETCVGFESYLLNYLNAKGVTNRGESGKTTPQICSRLTGDSATVVLSNFDILTIMGGNNDDRLDVSVGTVQPVGGTFDTTTVCGALQSAIEYALGINPDLRIILMTPPMGWTYQNGALDRVSELYPNAYRNVAKQYGLPVIDLYAESGINEFNRNTFYADPPDTENTLYMYHPNNDGWLRLSKLIIKKLKEYI